MDWNLTRPILARGGVTHNRLAMKRWGHKLQLSAPVQVDVFKLQVATISKDMSSSRWLFWYCEFCAGLTPYSPFQSFSYLCGSKGTPQLWYTQFPEFLVKIPKLVASNPALFAKSDPGCFKTRTVIVGPKHSSCCCLQFACLTPMFVAQDPDPCSFKPVLIPWFLASQHPDLSPAPIIFHIFLQESSTFSSELAVGKVSELWWTLRTSATWTKSIWTYTVCIYIYIWNLSNMIKPSRNRHPNALRKRSSKVRPPMAETPKHRGTITHSSVVPVANFMESWRCGGGVQRRPKHYAR